MTAAKVIQIGALTPRQLADMCRASDDVDRVELDGTTYRVYPKNPALRPVFFSSTKFGKSGKCENTLSDLRSSGIDVERRPGRTTAKPTAPKDTAMTAAADTPPTPRSISPMMTRQEGHDLRDMVRTAVDSMVEMLAQADTQIRDLRTTVTAQGRDLVALREQVASLVEGGSVLVKAPKPPSRSELIRRAVLAYLKAHAGMKLSPQLIELNIADELPADRSSTMVAGACKDLATAGLIMGGANRDSRNVERGIYWAEPEPDPKAEG